MDLFADSSGRLQVFEMKVCRNDIELAANNQQTIIYTLVQTTESKYLLYFPSTPRHLNCLIVINVCVDLFLRVQFHSSFAWTYFCEFDQNSQNSQKLIHAKFTTIRYNGFLIMTASTYIYVQGDSHQLSFKKPMLLCL